MQCFEDHCPTPALGFYEGNRDWAQKRCKADAYSLLGFVYRKRLVVLVARALACCAVAAHVDAGDGPPR